MRGQIVGNFSRWLVAGLMATGFAVAGATPAKAASITCTFGTFSSCPEVGQPTTGESAVFFDAARFAFDPDGVDGPDYYVDLFFDDVNGLFDVTITDTFITQAALDLKLGPFAGHICVPIYAGPLGPSCVEFNIQADDPGDDTWTSAGGRGNTPGNIGYDILISWFADTDPPFSNPKIIKDTGPEDGVYDFDITTPGTYFDGDPPPPPGCLDCSDLLSSSVNDPGIGGRDIQFSNNIVVAPEPTSLLMMGVGLTVVGYVVRRRRRVV